MSPIMLAIRIASLNVVLSVVLSACGGGGGGGAASPAANSAVIDTGNAAIISQKVLDVGLDAGTFGVAVGGGGILSADDGSNARVQGLTRRRATIHQVQPSASFAPTTADCLISGTVRLSGSLTSDSTLTPGDRITIDFNNCDDSDGALYDGRVRIDLTAFAGDIFNDQFLLGARVTLTDLAITEDGITVVGDGTVNLDLDLTVPLLSDLTLFGEQLNVRSGADAWTLRDFAVTVVEDNSGVLLLTRYFGTGTLEGSGFEGSVDFVTVNPLVATGSAAPATGEVLITGANGATIRATVLDISTVQLAIDLDGDGVVDDTQEIMSSTFGGSSSADDLISLMPRP